MNGALGKKPEVNSNGPLTSTYTYTLSNSDPVPGSTPPTSTTSVMSRGTIKGFARLDLELDVANAGEGTITISRTGPCAAVLIAEGRRRKLQGSSSADACDELDTIA